MSGLLGIARSALLAHQTALQTVSNNIANAETPGYSRQEVQLTPSPTSRMTYGNVGTGVSITSIIRKRNVLLDDGVRTANGNAGYTDMKRDLLQRVEEVFGEPSEGGLVSAMDQFWNAWSDLSASPNSIAARSVVQQRGRQVAQTFNDLDTALTQQRMAGLEQAQATVDRINSLATQVAELNGRIAASGGGQPSNELLDQRDLVLDELSRVAGSRTIPQADGNISVMMGNSTLVDGSTAVPLTLYLQTPSPAPTTPLTDVPVKVRLGDALTPLGQLAGELKAISETLNDTIPGLRTRIDQMANQLATSVNTVHSGGYVFSGNTIPGTAAGNFFDAGTVSNPVRAATLSLTTAVAQDSSKIAASGNINGPTDNTVARNLASLRIAENVVSYTSSTGAVEQGTFGGFFRGVLTRLGAETAAAADSADVANTLVSQAEARRQSVSGVNTDEELVTMLRVQQSYQAATKLVKTADEMLQTLLSMI